MVGSNEDSCTYPLFFHDTAGNLVFNYRDGSSGSGNHIFNIYDTGTKTWRRLLNAPFTDGQGQRNAYPVGPVLGPDAFWHMVWVLARDARRRDQPRSLLRAQPRSRAVADRRRREPDAADHARHQRHRRSGAGQNGGMINNNTKVGFDAQNRPIVAYHKFDSAGNTQLYNARFENGKWVPAQDVELELPLGVRRQGTLVFEIQVEPVKVDAAGALTQRWYHAQYGGWNAFALDPTTLAATAMLGRSLPYPASLETGRIDDGRHARALGRTTRAPAPIRRSSTCCAGRRWTRTATCRARPIPPPTRLRLYGFKK